jgi:uncharacterized protein (DUF58 family)
MTVLPTRRAVGLGSGVLALFAVGTNVQAGWVLAVAALLFGVLLFGALAPLRGLRRIEVARTTPARTAAGTAVAVDLELRNVGRPARGPLLIEDRFGARSVSTAPMLRGRSTLVLREHRVGIRRGVYEAGVVVLETGAPFGVVTVRRSFDVPTRLVVHPRIFPVSIDDLAARPEPGAEEDAPSVRDYRPGDAMRHIHWRSTARRGSLVVRERDQLVRDELAVVAVLPDDPDDGDAIASAACAVALASLDRTGRVQLLGGTDGLLASGRDAVLYWGARLAPTTASVVDLSHGQTDRRPMVLVAPAHRAAEAADVADAGRRVALCILVGPVADASAVARLAAAGVRVIVTSAPEIPTCLRARSIA